MEWLCFCAFAVVVFGGLERDPMLLLLHQDRDSGVGEARSRGLLDSSDTGVIHMQAERRFPRCPFSVLGWWWFFKNYFKVACTAEEVFHETSGALENHISTLFKKMHLKFCLSS